MARPYLSSPYRLASSAPALDPTTRRFRPTLVTCARTILADCPCSRRVVSRAWSSHSSLTAPADVLPAPADYSGRAQPAPSHTLHYPTILSLVQVVTGPSPIRPANSGPLSRLADWPTQLKPDRPTSTYHVSSPRLSSPERLILPRSRAPASPVRLASSARTPALVRPRVMPLLPDKPSRVMSTTYSVAGRSSTTNRTKACYEPCLID